MNDTPRTDALREVVIGQYKEDELTGDGMGNILAALTDIETLERDRDEARAALENYKAQSIHTCHDQCQRPMCVLRRERDALQEQLDAAIMLGKMQERRHERELEQVREQYRLSSVCRQLKEENDKLKQQQL